MTSVLWPSLALLIPSADAQELPVRHEVVEITDPKAKDFVRHHKLARTGTYVLLTGAAVGLVASIPASGTCFVDGGSSGCSFFNGIQLLGGLTFLAGDGMMFAGAIPAAYDARKLGITTQPELGIVGVALVSAGTVSFVVGVVPENDEDLLVLTGILGVVGGTALGIVQFAGDGHRRLSLAVVPAPNGFRVGAQF